jgi:hypothetical protein
MVLGVTLGAHMLPIALSSHFATLGVVEVPAGFFIVYLIC